MGMRTHIPRRPCLLLVAIWHNFDEVVNATFMTTFEKKNSTIHIWRGTASCENSTSAIYILKVFSFVFNSSTRSAVCRAVSWYSSVPHSKLDIYSGPSNVVSIEQIVSQTADFITFKFISKKTIDLHLGFVVLMDLVKLTKSSRSISMIKISSFDQFEEHL